MSDWYDDPETGLLLTHLTQAKNSHLLGLLSSGAKSSDPEVLKHAVAIKTIGKLIQEIEKRKGKYE
jgi:hypothetical protein